MKNQEKPRYQITQKGNKKILRSKELNYIFDKKTGFTATWGKTFNEDPEYSPFGPFIADIEVSDICHKKCDFCYKSNNLSGRNMSLETFKQVFKKIAENKVLQQIAFGIGSIDSNPQLYDIIEYCRDNPFNEVIPNITINGYRMTSYHYDRLAKLCGSVAVSHYGPQCFKAIQELSKRGLKQINIHQVLSQESLPQCHWLIDRAKDIEGLNAIVFLLLKPKGTRNTLTQLTSLSEYKKLVEYALEKEVPIGFDSCSCNSFIKAISGHPKEQLFKTLAEPCESFHFSCYINTDGMAYACSFEEGEKGREGIDVLNCNNFLEDVWYSPQAIKFREKNKESNRNCTIFDLEMK